MNNKNTTKNDHTDGQILGIGVTSTSISAVLTRVENLISCNTKFYIVTPNPELILMAQKDKKLKEAMNGTELAIPDGIGLAQATRYLSLKTPQSKILRLFVTFFQGLEVGAATFFNKKWLTDKLSVIKGREVFEELMKFAAKKSWKVFLLGGLDDEAKLALQKLEIRYQNLKIESSEGSKLDNNAEPVSEIDKKLQKAAIEKINKFAPQLLFVAFGNPKQEIWVHNYYSKLNIGGAMAIGGAFRYVAGLSRLPPRWMVDIGLEWLWRLVTEPHRISRIWKAVVLFPLKVFLSRISG